MGNFQEVFLILSLLTNLKLMSAFYSCNIFSLQVEDTLKLQGGKAHIMIMIYIYIFLSYVIFDQHLKITFRKS